METDRRAQQIQAVEQFKVAIDDAFGVNALLKCKPDRRHAIMLAIVLAVSALGGLAEWVGLIG